MDGKMRAYIYCRIGHADEAALELQKRKVQMYANEKGYEVLGVISDIGSGLTMDRPGWKQMIEAVGKQQVDAVLVTDIARISRDPRNVFECINYLAEHGIEVETLREGRMYNAKPVIKDMVEFAEMGMER